jgi:ribose/xylose/arabinose/galactoside ABC-type transport system permease subunit
MTTNKLTSAIKRVFSKDEAGMLAFLILLCVGIGLYNPSFWYSTNLLNLLRASSLTIMAAIGLTFILISGHIDLSIGSIIGLGGMISGLMMVSGIPIWLSILGGVLAGAAMGAFNGFIITRFNIPPLIVTLGSMYIARGIINVISEGRTIYPFTEEFLALGGREGFLSVPPSVWITLALCVVAAVALKWTVFGRCIFAIGGNKETARVSGINVNFYIIAAYVLAGALCAFSGIVQAAKVNSAIASAGTGWELTVMAAVIIGGTSMFGGVGSIAGSVIGSLVLAVLTNGMVMIRINAYWQNVVLGIIIILAVGMDQYKRINMERGRKSERQQDEKAGGVKHGAS